jgi:hypothetical protein
MTEQELQDAIGKLRAFAIEQGMQWVLDQVDEAIALGVPEERRLRQTNRRGQTTYEDVTPPIPIELEDPWEDRKARHSEEFIHSRPMTAREQAELLVDALRKVLIELDDIASGSLEALDPTSFPGYVDGSDELKSRAFPVPRVGTISFAPDEGSTAPAVSIEVIRGSRRAAGAAELLGAIEAEIYS